MTALIGEYKVSENEARSISSDTAATIRAKTTITPRHLPTRWRYRQLCVGRLERSGMHCTDGKDFSIFSILPPYNNLHAHLIDRSASGSKRVTSGVTLSYEAVLDTTGSINTESASKTNFWSW